MESYIGDPCKIALLNGIMNSISQGASGFKPIFARTSFESYAAGEELAMMPDVVLGHKTKKIALFLVGEDGCPGDSLEPNGRVKFKYLLVRKSMIDSG